MLTGGSLQKAKLKAVDGDPSITELVFMYNPAEITTSKSATWNRPQARGAPTANRPEFAGAGPQNVQMEIIFDAWDTPGANVTASVKTLFEWTKPTPTSITRKLPRPPMLGFEWGANAILQGYRCFLKTVQAKYTLFKPDGTPIRATCQITLEEIPEEPKGTNPTSGSRESRRSVILDGADSLAAVAYREYGDAALWRGIAAFNEIDDPFRVAAGTRILVPSRDEAKRFANGEG
jgi:nucleoid-associated protein YgaU